MVVQAHRSYVRNRNFYDNASNEIQLNIERHRNGSSLNDNNASNVNSTTSNICNINRTLPAHPEIHNYANSSPNIYDIDETLPAYHEIYNNATSSRTMAFDEISLPSYESAVIWSVRREEMSIPIPESLNAESATNLETMQSNSPTISERMKHCGLALGILILCVVPMFLIVFFTILR